MTDQYGREISYMRISVTDRCNLRCIYCMPEEGVPDLPHSAILRYEEILRICRAAAGLGIRFYKITGGEPLVRRGVAGLIREMKQLPGVEQVTMTTNGVLLGQMEEELADAGLDEVTVSLDTLDRETYRRLTRRDELPRVKESLEIVLASGRIPLKINCVPRRESRPEDLAAVAAFAKNAPVHVRFIEMMPIGPAKSMSCLGEAELKARLEPYVGRLAPYTERLGNGPARYYEAAGYRGKLGFISALSHRFCGDCNRIRLTSDGFLKSCLQYDTGEDLHKALTEGSDLALQTAIRFGILKKPAGHHFLNKEISGAEKRGMSRIGG